MTTILQTNSLFQVRKASRTQFPRLAQTARDWERFAIENNEEDSDGKHICSYIANSLEKACLGGNIQAYTCENSQIQAIAITKEGNSTLELTWLAGYPKNMPGKEKGAATLLVRTIAGQALANNQSISVQSISSSLGFYEKMGFKIVNQGEHTTTLSLNSV